MQLYSARLVQTSSLGAYSANNSQVAQVHNLRLSMEIYAAVCM